MIEDILIDDTLIKLTHYEEERVEGKLLITADFKVSSEDYHDITTLLYKEEFDVKIPQKNVSFRGKIQQYSTSVTNLYIMGQVGDFKLSLLEV